MSAFSEPGGWAAALTDLLARRDLSGAVCRDAMSAILRGDATPGQLAAFLVALRAKGETDEEMAGLLDAVLEASVHVQLPGALAASAFDIVGTGGDRSHSINVSTIAAFVIAGADVPVCKHGNRAASSKCGSADLLEALGVRIDAGPETVARCVERAGIGFCLAPRYHPAFRFAGPTRKEIGIPTVFNLLGPMANPARVRRQLIGVADPSVAQRMIRTLERHGSAAAWVVHGNGIDELSTTGPSTVLELRNGTIREFVVDPVALGLERVEAAALVGGDPAHNADAARKVLGGAPGPHRDIVVLNAAAALVVAGRAPDLAEGLEVAAASIDEGRAAEALDTLVRESQTEG